MPADSKYRFQDVTSRVRITDVAKLAGCAPATVSRTVNSPDKVSSDMRSRIERAMHELGYVRNHAARALRSQRSHMVGVLIPTLDYALYARLVSAASTQLSAAGILTLIATFDYNLDAELREARLLLERGAEALVLVGECHRQEIYELLRQFGVPFVNTYTFDPESIYPTTGFDNCASAAVMARHLVHLGHSEICVISGITEDNDRTTKRLEGIQTELERHGISLPASRIIESPYSISGGKKACALLLSRDAPQPTAIVCGNDVLALGALIECNSRGLEVPGDISLVGFDNLEFATHLNPPLTTIDIPASEMGIAAAEFILGKLSGNEVAMHNSVDVRLILRSSSAPPRDVGQHRTSNS